MARERLGAPRLREQTRRAHPWRACVWEQQGRRTGHITHLSRRADAPRGEQTVRGTCRREKVCASGEGGTSVGRARARARAARLRRRASSARRGPGPSWRPPPASELARARPLPAGPVDGEHTVPFTSAYPLVCSSDPRGASERVVRELGQRCSARKPLRPLSLCA